MSELIGTLVTFLPVILIVVLANLAERERARAQRSKGNLLVMVPGTVVPATQDAPASILLDVPVDDDPLPVGEEVSAEERRIPVEVVGPVAPSSNGAILAALAYLALGMIYALAAAGGAMILAISWLPELPVELEAAFAPLNSGLLGWGLLIASLLGVVVLLRPVRRLLAGILPIDPLSTVHAVALSMAMLVVIQTVFVMGIGIDTMADMMTQTTEAGGSGAVSLAGAWLSALVMALFGALGVGWLIRRNNRETLARLGIAMPTFGQVLASILIGGLMVGVIFAVEAISVALGWGVDEDVSRLTEQMLGGLMTTIPGVLTIGLAAGFGEETLMRGAVQPRLGLILTSVIFALLHANYGITLSTLAVLIVGLALGLVRQRFNTTSAMIVHATYNIIFGLIAYFSVGAV